MTGYQEAATDPSYLGQVLCFAAPMIGNYGAGGAGIGESDRASPAGVVMARRVTGPGRAGARAGAGGCAPRASWRVDDIDTRRLVTHAARRGAMRGGVETEAGADELLARVRAHPVLDGRDLAEAAAAPQGTAWPAATDGPRVVAVDCGMKPVIATRLAEAGARLEVVPSGTSAEAILARGPDAVFVSNGPGDPAAVTPVIDALGGVLGRVPVFGICMGHQLLAHALGLRTEKLPFGHRGANHPVRRAEDGGVEITVQNHGYAVVADALPDGVRVTRTSLFDGAVEGSRRPSCGPGPCSTTRRRAPGRTTPGTCSTASSAGVD